MSMTAATVLSISPGRHIEVAAMIWPSLFKKERANNLIGFCCLDYMYALYLGQLESRVLYILMFTNVHFKIAQFENPNMSTLCSRLRTWN